MTGFDSIVAEASIVEARAKGLGARIASWLPASAPARIEVVAERTSHVRSIVMPLLVVAAMVWAYRSGGESARADLNAYRVSAAEAIAAEKQREDMVSQAIRDAADKRQTTDKQHADALQSRIDDYANALASRPADARCSLTDDDVRRLRENAPSRHRNRPSEPARSGS